MKQDIRQRLETARERTLWLLDQVPDEFLRRRVHSFYSPVGWHFGHIGRTEEWWVICEALKQPCLNEHLSFLLADTPDNPKDNRVNIPDREGLKRYLAATRLNVLEALEETELDPENPYLREGYVWEFAVQHECQHQETIAEMLCLIHQAAHSSAYFQSAKPLTRAETIVLAKDLANASDPSMPISIRGGEFIMGSNSWCGYDNEKQEQRVEVEPFSLDETPVTAAQWAAFIAEHGYHRPELWSAEGWAWRCSEDAELPEYWLADQDDFKIFSPMGLRPILPDEPVSSISWYEAEAFCKWAKKRMPTEEEWEFAATSSAAAPGGGRGRVYPFGNEPPTQAQASFSLNTWGPAPTSDYPANPNGLRGLAGGTWEWTNSPFLPYPGFVAFPYDGYSKEHMRGEHRVCRGGSFATAVPILRCSFRNWYVPTYRQGFLGLRCAS